MSDEEADARVATALRFYPGDEFEFVVASSNVAAILRAGESSFDGGGAKMPGRRRANGRRGAKPHSNSVGSGQSKA